MINSLTFAQLSAANDIRNRQSFAQCSHWSGMQWGCCLAGEAGEACNAAKKLEGGGTSEREGTPEHIALELADVVIYADLMAQHYGIDLGEAVRHKFNLGSNRIKSDVML